MSEIDGQKIRQVMLQVISRPSKGQYLQTTQILDETLRELPANPDGYLAQSEISKINDISLSYLKEALRTYNSDCCKATAVMVGAATESLVLELRDAIVSTMSSKLSQASLKGLKSWKMNTILEQVKKVLDNEKQTMPRELREAYEAYWSTYIHEIRTSRNDAGHPKSIEPVTTNKVHASLLVFPQIAMLVHEIKTWLNNFSP